MLAKNNVILHALAVNIRMQSKPVLAIGFLLKGNKNPEISANSGNLLYKSLGHQSYGKFEHLLVTLPS